jgi:hypothetical protein
MVYNILIGKLHARDHLGCMRDSWLDNNEMDLTEMCHGDVNCIKTTQNSPMYSFYGGKLVG